LQPTGLRDRSLPVDKDYYLIFKCKKSDNVPGHTLPQAFPLPVPIGLHPFILIWGEGDLVLKGQSHEIIDISFFIY